MLGKKFASVGYFGCIYAFVYVVGSAIFGAVTPHVADYQLLRLVLFTAIAALIAFGMVTLMRMFDRALRREYLAGQNTYGSFLRSHRGFRVELGVVLFTMIILALALAFTEKQIVPAHASLPNWQLSIALLVIGYPCFILLDLASWAIACRTFGTK